MANTPNPGTPQRLGPLPWLIFSSRWLQLPLYLGLIVAQGLYVVQFLRELWHLVHSVSMDTAAHAPAAALAAASDVLVKAGIAADKAAVVAAEVLKDMPSHNAETAIMLTVLGLIDVVMISNLLVMVIVGGYETFVSRLGLQGHPDQPEWLSHVNAAVLKVKLATAIIGISSIHLLKTFIEAETLDKQVLIWQTV
ncbi:MAG: YqhA family protein, partial [Pseudomonadota bacterium]|nr:YqhA family protein [Pseudomonadota bacterium]